MKKVICEQCPCLDHGNGEEYPESCNLGYEVYRIKVTRNVQSNGWKYVTYVTVSDDCKLEAVIHNGNTFTPIELE